MSVLTSRGEFDHGRTLGHAVERAARLLRRAFNAVIQSRQRHVNDDIARYLHQSGGRLTDEIEREMMQQITRNWNLRI